MVRITTTLTKIAAERLEYERQGRCWGYGEIGYVRAKCSTNISKPLSISFVEGEESNFSGKDKVWD